MCAPKIAYRTAASVLLGTQRERTRLLRENSFFERETAQKNRIGSNFSMMGTADRYRSSHTLQRPECRGIVCMEGVRHDAREGRWQGKSKEGMK